MDIEVNNWEKYNPRKDLKSMPWFRLDNNIGYSEALFELSPEQKWLWIFILSTCTKKISSRLTINIKYVAYHSGVKAQNIEKYMYVFEKRGLINITNESDRISTDTIENVPNERTNEENEENGSIAEIITHLNKTTGKKYKTSTKKTVSVIKSLLSEGFSVDEFKKVIETKTEQWKHDQKMKMFLRPETLFGSKFESYLNEYNSEDVEIQKQVREIINYAR